MALKASATSIQSRSNDGNRAADITNARDKPRLWTLSQHELCSRCSALLRTHNLGIDDQGARTCFGSRITTITHDVVDYQPGGTTIGSLGVSGKVTDSGRFRKAFQLSFKLIMDLIVFLSLRTLGQARLVWIITGITSH